MSPPVIMTQNKLKLKSNENEHQQLGIFYLFIQYDYLNFSFIFSDIWEKLIKIKFEKLIDLVFDFICLFCTISKTTLTAIKKKNVMDEQLFRE